MAVRYCPVCGAPLEEGVRVCPKCGHQFEEVVVKSNNVLALIGFILSFFVALAGLIISAIVIKKPNLTARDHGFAKAGIIISIVAMVAEVIVVIVIIVLAVVFSDQITNLVNQ
jgi:uncharacterized membrane protein YvbJ